MPQFGVEEQLFHALQPEPADFLRDGATGLLFEVGADLAPGNPGRSCDFSDPDGFGKMGVAKLQGACDGGMFDMNNFGGFSLDDSSWQDGSLDRHRFPLELTLHQLNSGFAVERGILIHIGQGVVA